MIGPPGTGKSMLAQRLPGILPPMSEEEALASAAIASLAGRFSPASWGIRPFRAPHHTASAVALVAPQLSFSVTRFSKRIFSRGNNFGRLQHHGRFL